MIGTVESRVSNNQPWNLNEHMINNSDTNFYVKLVHVDRYNDIKKYIKTVKNKSSSVSVNKNRNENKMKIVPNEEVLPEKIVKSVSVWNERNKFNQSINITQSNEKYFSKIIDSPFNTKSSKLKIKFKQNQESSPRQRKFHTQYITSQRMRSEKQPINNTFSISSNMEGKRFKTDSNEIKMQSLYQNVPVVIRSSSKKQTIKQLVQFKPDENKKKKNYFMKKFKTILNKAKFSDMLPKQIKP